VKPTDLVRRADALLTEPSGDLAVDDETELPLLRGERWAGSVLTRVVVALALLTVLGAAACALLAWLGIWRPLVALPVLLVLLAVAVRVSAVVPGRPLPVWSAATLVTISVAATVWAGVTHSEQVLPRRDPGSYYQSAVNLAEHHRSPIVVPAATIGGPEVLDVPGVTLASPAFYQTGTAAQPSVQPQFVIGPSAWYSVGHWLGGPGVMLWVPAVFGGLGVLALGLLTSAVVGPRWGPLGAFATAICFPLLHVNRSTYSEPLALFVLAAGLLVLVAATDRGARGHAQHARVLGFVAGVLIGGGGLVRVDALRETVLLLPVAALMMIRRDGAGAALLGGAAAATGVSALAALALSGQYLGSIAGSLLPLVALGVVLALAAAGVVILARRGVRLPGAVRRRLAAACAALVLLAGVVLATRPLWHIEHQSAADPGSRVVAGLQLRQGLPVDGGRTYAEQSLGWTAWWTGPVAVAIAFLVLACAAHRLATVWVRGSRLPAWTGPYLVGLASVLLTWARPGITPDHPWADRRLFIVLPFVIGTVVMAAAWLTRWSTRRMPPGVLVVASVGTAALLLVPEALATLPHAGERVEAGSREAAAAVCRSLRPGDVALMVDGRAANEWPQVVRGDCGLPALSLTSAVRQEDARRAAAVGAVAQAVSRHGGRLVLLAADSPAALSLPAGSGVRVGDPVQVTDVLVREDARLLERRPDHTVGLPLRVWAAPVG
jgi:hypothetical protein